MRLAVLATLVGIALAAPAASAGVWSKGCQFNGANLATGVLGTSTNTNKRISYNEVGCYRFNAADGLHFSSAAAHGSTIITVTSTSALVAYDASLTGAATAASTTLVAPYYCPMGVIDVANPTFSCISVGGSIAAALSGIQGQFGVQNAAVRVGTGIWIFEISGVACPANTVCQITVQGEDTSD